jgi:two-component system chemotaxis response regulator CheB
MVVIGVSLGGLVALETLVSGLLAGFPKPVVIVQHRTVDAGSLLATLLRHHCVLPIIEPQDKEAIRPGVVYLAPPDYHLLIEGSTFALTTEAPVSYARPSIDVLFASAADAEGAKTIGVILTGANHDGAWGAAQIKARGGIVIVQQPETAECAVMPRAVLAATAVDFILPLAEIAPMLTLLCCADHGKQDANQAARQER